MGNSRADILAAARGILAEHSLADLTMRRLATEVGVRPNALYWHFPDKQTMLAALADDIVGRVRVDDGGEWDTALAGATADLRAALLSVPDSAEVVSSARASGLSSNDLSARLEQRARAGGLPAPVAEGLATALVQLTLGLTIEEQTRAQMERLGVIGPSGRDFTGEFTRAVRVIVDGARSALKPR
ncbi:MAG: TetR family transcriptional regulator [Gordonia sp. (in: high G+C Gram-positive bacteria)]|uniref:TetR/AcrR family transcriptional regulator n=1 Tax=Gordonia sp. (in: high G+C Gram-positive bacteria) TaxID=84139 RepID=UPI0039E438DB